MEAVELSQTRGLLPSAERGLPSAALEVLLISCLINMRASVSVPTASFIATPSPFPFGDHGFVS